MPGCLEKADAPGAEGCLLASRHLEPPATLRTRGGETRVLDGPLSKTRERLVGFNLIEADSFDEAVRIAHEFPEDPVRRPLGPVSDLGALRQRVSGET